MDFNPRSREGSDATGCISWDDSENFNPRSREGSDSVIGKRLAENDISIHAPARGATDYTGAGTELDIYFNPRSREGSDEASTASPHASKNISIHAPARGATEANNFFDILIRISIHAPARGATFAVGIVKGQS